ncbi:MAG: ribose-phosphate pyrophosphokinase [Candidatus Levybacteria bacterium]|nr:ribose-phosphate pyrophosphokinase [Candidatus Levybacteria bacterium]MDZ4227760.1 ribose-phosphate pyrophosphokinase [Candidatus Levybacteria bacterium]
MKEDFRGSLPATQQELYASFAPKTVDPDSFEIITGRGNIPLAQALGKLLGKTVDQSCSSFADGEIDVTITPNLRGRDVFIIQSMTPFPNDRVQEVVFMADASRRADALKTSAIIPYFAYARQDRKSKSRTPISAARVAKQIIGAGVNRIFTIDLHAEQSEGSIDEAWDNVNSSKLIAELIKKNNLNDAVVLSPDTGSTKRSEKFSSHLNGESDIAIVYKKRDVNKHDRTESKFIIGDVKGRPVIIYDDLISTGSTLIDAANLAKQNGAAEVIAAAAHGVFSPDKNGRTLPEKLKDPNCPIDKLIITDTILQKEEVSRNEKITIVSVAPIIAVAILCYLTHDSIGRRLID